MKLKFLTDCELTVVTHLNQEGDPVEESDVFEKGTMVECELVGHPERMVGGELVPDMSLWNIQFGDGAMVFGVSREWFAVVMD